MFESLAKGHDLLTNFKKPRDGAMVRNLTEVRFKPDCGLLLCASCDKPISPARACVVPLASAAKIE